MLSTVRASSEKAKLGISRATVGRCFGMVGTLAVVFLWVGVMLPARFMPRFGLDLGLVIMSAGVLFTGAAVFLHSKWWLLMLAVATATFVLFFIAEGA